MTHDSELNRPGVVARYREVFGGHRLPSRDYRFGAPNIVTDQVLGVVAGPDGVPVEISTGMMPVFGERPRRSVRVFGVTFAPPHHDRSQLVESLDEARSIIDI